MGYDRFDRTDKYNPDALLARGSYIVGDAFRSCPIVRRLALKLAWSFLMRYASA